MCYNLNLGHYPPKGILVLAMQKDRQGVRLSKVLVWDGLKWWCDDLKTESYFTPTHWDYLETFNNQTNNNQ